MKFCEAKEPYRKLDPSAAGQTIGGKAVGIAPKDMAPEQRGKFGVAVDQRTRQPVAMLEAVETVTLKDGVVTNTWTATKLDYDLLIDTKVAELLGETSGRVSLAETMAAGLGDPKYRQRCALKASIVRHGEELKRVAAAGIPVAVDAGTHEGPDGTTTCPSWPTEAMARMALQQLDAATKPAPSGDGGGFTPEQIVLFYAAIWFANKTLTTAGKKIQNELEAVAQWEMVSYHLRKTHEAAIAAGKDPGQLALPKKPELSVSLVELGDPANLKKWSSSRDRTKLES